MGKVIIPYIIMTFGVLCFETSRCLPHCVDSCWYDMRYRIFFSKILSMNEIQDSLFHDSKDMPILKSDRKQRISHFWSMRRDLIWKKAHKMKIQRCGT